METEGRTPLSNVIVGCVMMLLSMVCAVSYTIILKILWKGDLMKMASYKLMFVLGVFDTIQCIPHFITGIFTIKQSVFHPILSKSLGVLATPSYIAYITLTMVLSFNRLVLIYSSHLEAKFFSKPALYLWIGSVVVVWLGYAICLSTPWVAINYVPERYSWNYDYSLDFSLWVQKSEILVEFGNIFLSTVFHALTIGILFRTRRRFRVRSSYRAEMKLFIQAFIVNVYCIILNLLWHNSKLVLPANIWSYMALNIMWILSAGINPLMYFVVNRVIREQMTGQRSNVSSIILFRRRRLTTANKKH